MNVNKLDLYYAKKKKKNSALWNNGADNICLEWKLMSVCVCVIGAGEGADRRRVYEVNKDQVLLGGCNQAKPNQSNYLDPQTPDFFNIKAAVFGPSSCAWISKCERPS